MAIDRQAIIDAVFDGRYKVATGVVSPNFDGYRANVCKYCKLDVAQAKSLLAAAGGWKGGKLQLWTNAGIGHDKWLQAVGDQIKANLGIDYELKVNLQRAAYLETGDNRGFTGPFHSGWGPDYPIIETYLAPLYATGGSSNSSFYENPRSTTSSRKATRPRPSPRASRPTRRPRTSSRRTCRSSRCGSARSPRSTPKPSTCSSTTASPACPTAR